MNFGNQWLFCGILVTVGVAERKNRERRQRQELFVDVAERLFRERGDSATIDEITRAAEFSKRTFYLYFQDKNDIVAAVAHRALERLNDRIAEALERSTDSLDGIRRLAWAYFEFFAQERESYDRHLRYEESAYHYRKSDRVVGPYGLAYADRVARRDEQIHDFLARAITRNEIATTLEPHQLLLVVWGQCAGMLRVIAAREGVLDSAYSTSATALFEEFVDQLVRGLCPPEPIETRESRDT